MFPDADDFREVYNCQFQLAQFFESTEDKWLSDHFYRSCLSTSLHVASDEGKTMAEAHCMLGVAQEVNGTLLTCVTPTSLTPKSPNAL